MWSADSWWEQGSDLHSLARRTSSAAGAVRNASNVQRRIALNGITVREVSSPAGTGLRCGMTEARTLRTLLAKIRGTVIHGTSLGQSTRIQGRRT